MQEKIQKILLQGSDIESETGEKRDILHLIQMQEKTQNIIFCNRKKETFLHLMQTQEKTQIYMLCFQRNY